MQLAQFFLAVAILFISSSRGEDEGGDITLVFLDPLYYDQENDTSYYEMSSNPQALYVPYDQDDYAPQYPNVGSNSEIPAMQKTTQWVMGQMNPDWGWGMETPRTVLALSIADPSWFALKNLKSQLVVKQFDLQLILRLWKPQETVISKGQIALHVMSLISLCRDPRDFYGEDLVALLGQPDETYKSDFEYFLTTLASCLAGNHVKKSTRRRILNIISYHSKIQFVDTMSMGILALRCSELQRGMKNKDSEHPNSARKSSNSVAMETLLNMQKPDGSFNSNFQSTTMAWQAMMASGYGDSLNAEEAKRFVLSHGYDDGSYGFGTVFDTTAVLPLLASKTLLDIGGKICPKEKNSASKLPKSASEYKIIGDEKINMTYIIWVGEEPSMTYNISLTVPKNANFLDVMEMAAKTDVNFKFSKTDFEFGAYIHTLAGIKERERQNGFWSWILYRFREPPIPGIMTFNDFISPVGVSELIPNDGDYILYWYHRTRSINH